MTAHRHTMKCPYCTQRIQVLQIDSIGKTVLSSYGTSPSGMFGCRCSSSTALLSPVTVMAVRGVSSGRCSGALLDNLCGASSTILAMSFAVVVVIADGTTVIGPKPSQ